MAYAPQPLAAGARRHPKAEAAGLAPKSVRQADGTRRIQKWRLIGSEVSQNRKLINKKLAESAFGQHFLMLERIFQRNSITFEDDYLRFPGYICDSEFLFAIPEIYLRS